VLQKTRRHITQHTNYAATISPLMADSIYVIPHRQQYPAGCNSPPLVQFHGMENQGMPANWIIKNVLGINASSKVFAETLGIRKHSKW
jgi:hypothetical protein